MHYRRNRLYGDPLSRTPKWAPKICSVIDCDRPYLARAMCDVHYARWRRHGSTDDHKNQWHGAPSERERFEARINRTPTCWLWTGPPNNAGYGTARLNGKPLGAHVIAVLLDGRSIPAGMEPDHLCTVRLCVRPNHLEVVTHAENLRRARRRSLQAR